MARRRQQWEWIGDLLWGTEGGEAVVGVYKLRKSVELRRGEYNHLVHAINEAGVEGWKREAKGVWGDLVSFKGWRQPAPGRSR